MTEQVASGGAPHMFVQFRLEAAASCVQLAGSFTNWEPRYELLQACSRHLDDYGSADSGRARLRVCGRWP